MLFRSRSHPPLPRIAAGLTPTGATTGDFASHRHPLSSPPVVEDRATTAAWAGGANTLLSAAELLPPGHPDPSVACSPPAASSPSTQPTEDGGRRGYALVLAWPRFHKAMLDPAGAEPFACAHSGVPAYAYYGHDREANVVMHDDEHLLKDILLGDAPLRQHLQRVVQKGMFLDSAAMDVLLDRQGRGQARGDAHP